MTPVNLNLIPTPIGQTYTNFVDFLNQAFASLGLSNYIAQISINNAQKPTTPYAATKYDGFYIIRPIGDTFSMYISETNNMDVIYTQNSSTDSLGGGSYRNSICTAVEVENGQVIE
jgi:hypothetical protein